MKGTSEAVLRPMVRPDIKGERCTNQRHQLYQGVWQCQPTLEAQ